MAFQKEKCPYCEYENCEADWVDVRVGYQQCAPYYCENCGASEIGSCDDLGFDKNKLLNEHHKKYLKRIELQNGSVKFELTKKFEVPSCAKITQEEWDVGWYKPGSSLADTVNTFNEKPMNHKVAKQLYELGLLDIKGE